MKLFSTLLFASIVLFACQKEVNTQENDAPETPSTKDYIITTEGSYWVYENYSVDVNGTETALEGLDTITCLGTETINGVAYTVYGTSYNPLFNTYLRDSNGFVIDQYGNVNFSLNNVGEVFSSRDVSSLVHEEVKVEKVNQDLSTEAGAFETVHVKATYAYLDGSPFNACSQTSVPLNTYYTKGVGKVWIEYAYLTELQGSCTHRVRKLKSYYIAK